jgi:hypothetical protein
VSEFLIVIFLGIAALFLIAIVIAALVIAVLSRLPLEPPPPSAGQQECSGYAPRLALRLLQPLRL